MDIRENCSRKYYGVVCSGGRRSQGSIWTVVVHQTQGETAAGAASYLHTRPDGSVHLVVDDLYCFRLASDGTICCGVAGYNHNALHIEMAGHSTIAWWFPFSAKRRRMLRRCAYRVALWLHKHQLPNVYLTTRDLVAGERRGWTTHANLTNAGSRIGVTSTHQDPWPFRKVKANVPRRYLTYWIRRYLKQMGESRRP